MYLHGMKPRKQMTPYLDLLIYRLKHLLTSSLCIQLFISDVFTPVDIVFTSNLEKSHLRVNVAVAGNLFRIFLHNEPFKCK